MIIHNITMKITYSWWNDGYKKAQQIFRSFRLFTIPYWKIIHDLFITIALRKMFKGVNFLQNFQQVSHFAHVLQKATPFYNKYEFCFENDILLQHLLKKILITYSRNLSSL